MKIGIIGAGTIGNFLLEKINQEKVIPGARITAIFDERKKSNQKLDSLSEQYHVEVYDHFNSFLTSPTSLIVECATIDVVKQYAKEIVLHKDLFLISVGALADLVLTEELHTLAEQKDRKVYLPSGAIGGLDVLRAANILDGLDSVQLITRKPAYALTTRKFNEQQTVFEGKAKEAIAHFPKNTNIAIIISLAGIGAEKTKVKIIADPTIHKNVHQLIAKGDFGRLTLELENNTSPNNPKTSYLTALSILSSLKSLDQAIVIG